MAPEPEQPSASAPPASEPYPDLVGYSLANVAELLFGCLETVDARSVAEVGAFEGALTRVLLDWAKPRGAQITAIDPLPPEPLSQLADRRPDLQLLERTSHDALREMPLPDALIIDGDHNYFTVSEELRLISERSPGGMLPLLLFHDVCWPHARRDSYYDPDRVPEDARQPLQKDAAVRPGDPGIAATGLRYPWVAAAEGGPGNGVLTAIEDFVEAHERLRLVVVPAFFGFGVVWHQDSPSAAALASLLDPWDRNPVLERLEHSRVTHLVSALADREQLQRSESRRTRQEELLRTMLASKAFIVGEQLSRLRQRGRAVFSRSRVQEALAEPGDQRP